LTKNVSLSPATTLKMTGGSVVGSGIEIGDVSGIAGVPTSRENRRWRVD
jgi:hypothetical protein